MLGEIREIKNLTLTKPAGYFDFIKLTRGSFCVITDSGGIQEEAAFLKIPVLTLRTTTERPSTIECGSNQLIKLEPNTILRKLTALENKRRPKIKNLALADGKASRRIVNIILTNYGL
jgi:UDP-N-acetylglucosamine 2-epimerase (non-hydrolysing)